MRAVAFACILFLFWCQGCGSSEQGDGKPAFSPSVYLKDNLDEADNLGWCPDIKGHYSCLTPGAGGSGAGCWQAKP